MNSPTLKGQLKELTGQARQEWGKLTHDDWLQIEGDFERLSGAIQTRYGVARDHAEEQVRAFMKRIEEVAKPVRKPRSASRGDPTAVTARERAAAGL